MIHKPKINREEVLRKERIGRQVRLRFDKVCALIEEGERLGVPYREGSHIILPIAASNDQDASQRRMLKKEEVQLYG